MDIPSKLGIPDDEFRLVFGGTKIDYDPEKEEINRKKHEYSLESAVNVLERVILPFGNTPCAVSDAFKENGEVRYMVMSVDDNGKVVIMATTMRHNETVRIISFRRAHRDERIKFQQLTGYDCGGIAVGTLTGVATVGDGS
ncbi:MAG: BrnT family toxin [Magnetococcales bacterium]|nr:BrnT family toxin [Magnetococcales bacterium]MBF0116468.1 BrnT family toxin [Magnetococcales bacterium]